MKCNNVKDINIKNHTYYFFDDIINIREFDPNNVKLNEKSYKNILIYYIAYVTIKDSKYVKVNSVNPLYLMLNKINGYFEESKEKRKKYKKLWIKIRDLIRSVTRRSDDYDEKYMKIKFNSDNEPKQNDKNPCHCNSCLACFS